jgi:hypothetical protein
MNTFVYRSNDAHVIVKNGKPVITETVVTVKGNKGIKKKSTVHGKQKKTTTHKLTRKEIANIKARKFMPNFFAMNPFVRPIGTRRSRTIKKKRSS